MNAPLPQPPPAAPVWDPDPRPVIRWLILAVALLFAALLLWAALSRIERTVRAEGKVIPSARLQLIQNAERGVVSELLVRQGDLVEAGQPLVKMDDVQVSSSAGQGTAKVHALEAEVARLQAEATGAAQPVFPHATEPAALEAMQAERRLFEERRRELRQALGNLDRSLSLARQQLAINRPLAEKGLVAEVEMLRLQRDIADLEGRRSAIDNGFRSKVRADLAEKQGELAGLREAMRGAADRLDKTMLRSPLRGVVKQVNVTTIGGVFEAGATLMEIVPIEDAMVVEAYVLPADIGFLTRGLDASVRITAFDSSIYGALPGKLEFISADSVYLETLRGNYFRILVRTEQTYFQVGANRVLVSPGMTATVDVITGERSVLEYLLRPVLRARQLALRER